MKAVILAGGLGTRLSEETSIKPKPISFHIKGNIRLM
jgi:NDP-sugar pyrophosphorylase family protein